MVQFLAYVHTYLYVPTFPYGNLYMTRLSVSEPRASHDQCPMIQTSTHSAVFVLNERRAGVAWWQETGLLSRIHCLVHIMYW